MNDYFTSRKQYILTGGKKSVCLPNDYGVFQGAVLSPFLFTSYLDQLTSNDVRIIKYADDIAVCHPEKSAADPEVLLRSLNDLKTWCAEHRLVVNASECRQIVFVLRPISNPVGSPIEFESITTFKYIGVTFSENATWSAHIETVFQKGCDCATLPGD